MLAFNDTVAAAVIAACASWLGLVISKESKVSEFRQKWIDGLRKDISSLFGEAADYHASILGVAPRSPTKRLNELMFRIRLRLNFKEPEHRNLFAAIVAYRSIIISSYDNANDVVLLQERAGEKADEVSHLAAHVLKTEWNVVKRGEFVYRYTFRGLMLFIAYAILSQVLHRDLWFRHAR